MLYAVINGIPIKHIVRYVTVPETASFGMPITPTRGLTRIRSSIVHTAESVMNKVIVLPTADAVFFLSPAPAALPITTVVPIASPTIITVIMCIIWLPLVIAVIASTPLNLPVIYKSAIP